MKWNKFTLKTRSEVEDIVISTLADVGIEGVEIQDKQPLTESDKQQMFVDIMPDIPDDDGNKCFERNLEEASKWPATYAEVSKSGCGIHLHYIYTGDVSRLSRVYDDHIEPILDGSDWVLDQHIDDSEAYNFNIYPYNDCISLFMYDYEGDDGTACAVSFYMRLDGTEWNEELEELPPRYEEYKAALANK